MAIVKVFLDVNMGLQVPGLTKVLEENKIALKAVRGGDMFMFVNTRRTQVKIMWGGQFLLSVRKEKDQISVADLKKIPSYFNDALVSGKMEKHLNTFLSQSTKVVIDDHGLRIA